MNGRALQYFHRQFCIAVEETTAEGASSMYLEDTSYHVEFENSHEAIDIPLADMGRKLVDFLEHYGEPYLLGQAFCETIGDGDGETKFHRLLQTAGHADDSKGFLTNLADKLARAGKQEKEVFAINGITLPYLLLVSMMEIILPGNRFISVRDVSQYEKLANIIVPEGDRADLQKVLDTYPVRLSMHTIRQMRISRHVAYQYAPFVEELDPVGQTNTWIGQFHDGLLERMYENRVIFLLNMTCPVYCRFCFRKHKDLRNQTNPTEADVRKAVEYVNQSPTIKEIVITGGDPFLNKKNMMTAVDGLKEVPHVQSLRLATRSISYYPHLFYDDDGFWLNTLKMKNLELQQRGKRLEIATHFIHPDEISLDSLDIISKLVESGIRVYVQTPFLNDCNDEGPELARLFHLLRGAGAELHYIYIPCSPIHGNSVYWTPIVKGHQAADYLRAHLSDRIIPRLCTATPIGKIDWHSSGWAVAPDTENERFVWIRTPYTPDYFKDFAEKAHEQEVVRINEEGTLDARFMARIGDESLFMGSRKPRPQKEATLDSDALSNFQALALNDQRIGSSVVSTGSATLNRPHETRVEIDADATEQDVAAIRNDPRITDVLITSERDAVEHLYHIGKIIENLRGISHVNAVRLRSLKFNYAPGIYTHGVLEKLGNLNHLSVADPLRLEIETQFLHTSEIRPDHEPILKALGNRGVTVYNNTPLLCGINDSADEMHRLAFALRGMGMEFHHVYAAGWPLQKQWGEKHPVDAADVIDIASRVRRDGSGREIPRYIILTELGEVDFGLTSRFVKEGDGLWIKLLPYDLAYFQGMDPGYHWPQGVKTDPAGRPMVRVSGLTSSMDFMIGL
jgi:lysine 2,3-aminomutase